MHSGPMAIGIRDGFRVCLHLRLLSIGAFRLSYYTEIIWLSSIFLILFIFSLFSRLDSSIVHVVSYLTIIILMIDFGFA